MKKNPFYGMSAAAMLLGCYLLNHALELEPGCRRRPQRTRSDHMWRQEWRS